MIILLTTHVRNDLIPEVVLLVPGLLQIGLEPLEVLLQLRYHLLLRELRQLLPLRPQRAAALLVAGLGRVVVRGRRGRAAGGVLVVALQVLMLAAAVHQAAVVRLHLGRLFRQGRRRRRGAGGGGGGPVLVRRRGVAVGGAAPVPQRGDVVVACDVADGGAAVGGQRAAVRSVVRT